MRHKPHNFLDITGQRYGRLVAIRFVGNKKWLFRCDCGIEKEINGSNVRLGKSTSCGCYRNSIVSEAATHHGMSFTPEHNAWLAAKGRCCNENNPAFAQYGGRGITICEEWLSDFEAFYKHIGPRPPGCSLDRIDNDGNYEPGNVRWATREEQAQNRRSNCLSPADVVIIRQSTKTDRALAKDYNVSQCAIQGARRGFTWKNIP